MRRITLPVLFLASLTVCAAACSSATTAPTDGGTTAATAPTTDGSTVTPPPPDASASSVPDAKPFVDSAPPPPPPPATFDITSGICVDTPPCGGALEGTWDYTATCVPDTAFAQLTAACPAAKLTALSGKMSGRLTVRGSAIERKATLALKATINVPSACAAPLGGCGPLGTALKASGAKSATCAAVAAGCDCDIEADTVLDKTGTTFTTSGDTLRTSDGDEYSYCVAGTKLTHKQTKSGNPNRAEFGSYEAKKL